MSKKKDKKKKKEAKRLAKFNDDVPVFRNTLYTVDAEDPKGEAYSIRVIASDIRDALDQADLVFEKDYKKQKLQIIGVSTDDKVANAA